MLIRNFGFFLCLIIGQVVSTDFYSYTVQTNEEKDFSLEYFRGKVSLVVNVASECGYTESTYRALTRLHDILSYDGYFNVLAFPCNQFGDQEPGDISDIVNNAVSEYGIEFPMFNKIDVIGANANPAFRHLIEQSAVTPDWNFYKYLVDGDGEVVNVWGTKITIEEIFDNIEEAVHKAEESARRRQNMNDEYEEQSNQVVKDEL